MKISIIIPFYNAEEYIKTSIESILNQTLDFKENIEIILVDDGSTDNSKKVCEQYLKEYPVNIKYFYSENKGPSSARNIGIENVSTDSKIIGFLDADDYLSKNVLKKVKNFFEKNRDIKMAVIPLFHFEKVTSPHKLNYRFKKGTRVINILEEYKSIHFHIGGCFFDADTIKKSKKWRFRTDLRFWEDALFINSFLLEYKNYGVISDVKYFYRKHIDDRSLVDNSWYQKSRYIPMIEECYGYLVHRSKELYKKIIPYVQYLIIYHFRLYLVPKNNSIIYNVLSSEEQSSFFTKAANLIKSFDEKYIHVQSFPYYYKIYLINLKRNGWPYRVSFSLPVGEERVTIKHLRVTEGKWYIEGHFKNKAYTLKEKDTIFVKRGDDIILSRKKQLDANKIIIWDTIVRDHTYAGFTITIPISWTLFQFGLQTENKQIHYLNHVNMFKFLTKKVIKKLLEFFFFFNEKKRR